MENNGTGKEKSLRQKAEETLSRRMPYPAKLSEEDARRLLHELQIHQVELEMQNEELRKTQAFLEESRAHYFDLYNSAPVGYFTFSSEVVITEVNLCGARILGIERVSLIGKPFAAYVASCSKDDFHRHLKKLQSGSRKEKCEVKLLPKDGREVWVLMETSAGESLERNDFRSVVVDIMEKRTAEEALYKTTERERFLADLIEKSTQPLGIGYPDGRLGVCNRAFCDLTGYSAEELLGLDWTTVLTPPEWIKSETQALAALERTGMPVRYQKEYIRKDGSRVPVELLVDIDRDDAGRPLHYYAFVTDITARNQAEKALCEAETRYCELFENINVGVAVYEAIDGGRDFVFKDFNRAGERIDREDRRQLIGRSVLEVRPGIEQFGLLDVFRRVWQTGKPEHHPVTHYKDNVMTGWYENYVYRLPSGEIVAVFDNVTERKRSEEALRESEMRFRSLIEGAPEGIFVQCGGIIRYVNQTMMRLLGAARTEDLLGQSFMKFIAPEYHEAIRNRIQAQLEDGIVAPMMEQEFLCLNGTRIPVETTAVAVMFQGEVGHLVFIHDITPRRQAEKERASIEAQLNQAQKIETVGRLAGGIAHDFNNMLGVILGYGEMALRKLHPGDPLRDDIQEIVVTGQRSAALTRQLLAFSRKQTLQPEILDLTPLVRNLDKMLRRIIGEDITLELVLAENVGRVLVDPGQIEQVILNLSVNARDAMPQGGKLLIETADAELDETYAAMHPGTLPGKYVLLAVTDTGCGISEEIVDKIFDPFFSTKDKGKGTGLGLSTVYGIVKQSGGNICVCSEPGKGATFKIYLPQTEAPQKSAIARTEMEAPATGREHILVVEDEESLRKLITNFLSMLGYTVAVAANGGEALLLVEEKGLKPDLVVTDVVMPNLSGKELIDRLRRKYPNLRALYMSGYVDNTIMHHGVIDPDMPFIQKPFSIHDFAKKLRAVLECNSK